MLAAPQKQGASRLKGESLARKESGPEKKVPPLSVALESALRTNGDERQVGLIRQGCRCSCHC